MLAQGGTCKIRMHTEQDTYPVSIRAQLMKPICVMPLSGCPHCSHFAWFQEDSQSISFCLGCIQLRYTRGALNNSMTCTVASQDLHTSGMSVGAACPLIRACVAPYGEAKTPAIFYKLWFSRPHLSAASVSGAQAQHSHAQHGHGHGLLHPRRRRSPPPEAAGRTHWCLCEGGTRGTSRLLLILRVPTSRSCALRGSQEPSGVRANLAESSSAS